MGGRTEHAIAIHRAGEAVLAVEELSAVDAFCAAGTYQNRSTRSEVSNFSRCLQAGNSGWKTNRRQISTDPQQHS